MRRKDREIKEISEVIRIVEKAKILRLGLFDEEFPHIVPLHYGFEFKEGNFIFYAHSAKTGHKLDLIVKNPKVCVELDCDIELVPSPDEAIPCKYGSKYASVIAKGKAELINEVQEKIYGLKLLMKNQTAKDFVIDEIMAARVAVIKITTLSWSAKSRKY